MDGVGQLKIGVLGGSGRVGSGLRREMRGQVAEIRVLDLAPPAELGENESFRPTDILDLADLTQAFQGLDALVHLAGIPKEAPLADILSVNCAGTSNVYEAARIAGIGRVVQGSSNHAIGCYARDEKVGSTDQMRPDGLYGLSKCWGELVAGLYWDKHGIRSLIVRIGNSSVRPLIPRSMEVWLSPRDFCQLTLIGLSHAAVTATTVFGVSKGGGAWWDMSVAEKLGYRPQDLITDFAAPEALLPEEGSPVELHFQGGRYAAADHDGVIRRRS